MKYNIAEFIGTIQDGGAETLVKDYSLILDKSKFNVTVIVIRRRPGTANDTILVKNGVKIISIFKNNTKPFKIIQKINQWWYVPYKLNKILKQENINVLHVHLSLLDYVSKISKKIKNVKLFYTCHSDPKRLFGGKNESEGSGAKKLIKNNNLQMIALHEDMRREINKMFDIHNTVVIRNGIDFGRFHNVKETKKEIRSANGIPDDAYVIGHVGRFVNVKNHDFLVDVFNKLYKRKNNAFLLMIGDGQLKQQIKEKLDLLGLKGKYMILSHRSDIPQLMKAMDIFVFPSHYEGLSLTLVEAQVSGLRCIVSDKVNEESILTEDTILLDINNSPKEWCDVILDDTIKGIPISNLDDYDMNREIKRLEWLYTGELNG